jgi:Lysylphosphatidylglycerol synthase TM region
VDDRARAAEERTLRSALRWTLSLAVLLAVVVLAVRQAPRLAETLAGIDATWAVLGLAAFWCGHLLRSVRLRRFVSGGMRLWPTAASVNAVHAVAVYLLPLQSGELALPGVLGWAHGRRLAESVDILLRSRLLDVSALGCWISAATLLLPAGRISLGLRLGALGVGLALACAPWLVRRLGALARVLPSALGRGLHAAAHASRASLDDFGLSLAIWALSGSCVWAAARAVGLELGFWDVWLLLGLQLPLQFLPVQGVANTGSHELSWVAGLAVFGVPAADALRFALASHALILGYVVTLVPLGATAWHGRTAPGTR